MSAISAQLATGLSQFSLLSTEVSLANELLAAPGARLSAAQKTWLGKFLVVAGNFVVNVVVLTAAAIIPGENNSKYDATIPIIGGLITAGYFLFFKHAGSKPSTLVEDFSCYTSRIFWARRPSFGL